MNKRLATLALAAPLAACGNTGTPTSSPEPPSEPALVVTSVRWEAPQPVADAGERPFRRCSPYTQSLCRLFDERTVPAVAMNARGQAVALWQRHEGNDMRLVAVHTAGAGWTEAEPVTSESGVREHHVVIDRGGNAVALWFGASGAVTSSRLATGGWSAPQEAEASDELAMDDGGAVHTVFTRWREGVFWSRLSPGGAWTEPVLLQAQGPTSQPAITDPQIAVTRGGVAHAMWVRHLQSTVRSEEWNEVWSSRMPPGQGWTPPVRLAHFPRGHALSPALAATDTGALALYELVEPTQEPADLWRVVEQHDSGAQAWTPPGPVSEPAPPPPGRRNASRPALASDTRGALTLAWTEVTYAPSEPNRYEIRARRFSTATGTWEHAQLVASEQGYLDDRRELHLAASAAGNAVVLWMQQDSFGVGFRLWASVFVPGSGWSAAQALREARLISAPALAMDGSGNAIVLWSEPEGDRTRIWSARLAAVTARP